MTDLALERGHEVYLVDASGRRLRVCVHPSWALVPGSRLANVTRAFWTKTQTADTATSGVGIAGSALAGLLWLLVIPVRWLGYQARRRRDWTVTVSSYQHHSVKLTGRREPVLGRAVRTLDSSRHTDLAEALVVAKARAASLVGDGFRLLAYPVGWDSH